MPRDGCRECSIRRIKCDKGTPECGKCLKKGIRCSGFGKQFTFIGGTAGRGRSQKGQAVPASSTSSQSKADPRRVMDDSHHERFGSQHNNTTSLVLSKSTTRSYDVLPKTETIRDKHDYDASFDSIDRRGSFPTGSDPVADCVLELLEPGVRMLFSYYSENIASIIVAFDCGHNGYRDVLLPLAYHDEMVQRAVAVVAAYHVSSLQPNMLPYAEAGRAAIIQRLVTNAASTHRQSIVNLSTWATLILLLVGETVTGSNDFVHIYPMLMGLLRHARYLGGTGLAERQFLLQQTRMFQLFVPPLLDRDTALKTHQVDLQVLLDWLLPQQSMSIADTQDRVHIFQDAIVSAHELYKKQASHTFRANDLYTDLEGLKQMVLPITPSNPGIHILLWVHFIAAASSQDIQQRSFFSGRLLEVYQKTRMNNLLVAVKQLEQIWLLQPNGEWAREPTFISPVLVI